MKQIPKVINQPKPTIHVKAWFIQSAKVRISNTFAYFSIGTKVSIYNGAKVSIASENCNANLGR